MTTSHRFEDRLLEQLLRVVAERPEPAAVLHRRPRRTRLPLAGAGVAAATVAIVFVATSSDVTPGAYAVDSRPDGAVSVSISSLRDADGLQRSLRAAGIPAFVDYAVADERGCATRAEPRLEGPPGDSAQKTATRKEVGGKGETGATSSSDGGAIRRAKGLSTVGVDSSGAATFSIDPGALKPGENVYITTSTGAVSSIGMAIGKHKPSAGCITTNPTP
jgi:hypothetical protein